MFNWPLLYIVGCYHNLFLELDDMEFRLSKDNRVSRNSYNLSLFLDIRCLDFLYLDDLSVKLDDLFSFDSLDIDLNYWLFVEYWFLNNYFNWSLDLDWDLDSLLNWNNLSNLNYSINKSVDVDFNGSLFNNFHYFLFDNLRICLRLNFDHFSHLLIINFLYNL